MNLTIRQDMTVDLRDIAAGCGIEHESAMMLLKKHRATLEEAFGLIRFEIGVKTGPQRGMMPKIAYLTEDQATFFVTLAQNTKQVVKFKCALVKAFSDAKRKLQIGGPATNDQIRQWVMAEYVRRTRPVHDFGTPAKDGRMRVGYRGPTFTVTAGRLDDASMVAASLNILENPELPLFLEASK